MGWPGQGTANWRMVHWCLDVLYSRPSEEQRLSTTDETPQVGFLHLLRDGVGLADSSESLRIVTGYGFVRGREMPPIDTMCCLALPQSDKGIDEESSSAKSAPRVIWTRRIPGAVDWGTSPLSLLPGRDGLAGWVLCNLAEQRGFVVVRLSDGEVTEVVPEASVLYCGWDPRASSYLVASSTSDSVIFYRLNDGRCETLTTHQLVGVRGFCVLESADRSMEIGTSGSLQGFVSLLQPEEVGKPDAWRQRYSLHLFELNTASGKFRLDEKVVSADGRKDWGAHQLLLRRLQDRVVLSFASALDDEQVSCQQFALDTENMSVTKLSVVLDPQRSALDLAFEGYLTLGPRPELIPLGKGAGLICARAGQYGLGVRFAVDAVTGAEIWSDRCEDDDLSGRRVFSPDGQFVFFFGGSVGYADYFPDGAVAVYRVLDGGNLRRVVQMKEMELRTAILKQ